MAIPISSGGQAHRTWLSLFTVLYSIFLKRVCKCLLLSEDYFIQWIKKHVVSKTNPKLSTLCPLRKIIDWAWWHMPTVSALQVSLDYMRSKPAWATKEAGLSQQNSFPPSPSPLLSQTFNICISLSIPPVPRRYSQEWKSIKPHVFPSQLSHLLAVWPWTIH